MLLASFRVPAETKRELKKKLSRHSGLSKSQSPIVVMLISSTWWISRCLACMAWIRATGVAALPWRNTRMPLSIILTAASALMYRSIDITRVVWMFEKSINIRRCSFVHPEYRDRRLLCDGLRLTPVEFDPAMFLWQHHEPVRRMVFEIIGDALLQLLPADHKRACRQESGPSFSALVFPDHSLKAGFAISGDVNKLKGRSKEMKEVIE